MSLFGKLFGTKKAIDNITDKDNGLLTQVGGWIGGMNYTDEEKAEANKDTREWAIRHLEALAPFKIVQRILAFTAAGLWVFVGLNVVAAIWINAIYGIDARTDLLAFATSDYIFWPVISVFSLYCSGGVVNSFKNKGK